MAPAEVVALIDSGIEHANKEHADLLARLRVAPNVTAEFIAEIEDLHARLTSDLESIKES